MDLEGEDGEWSPTSTEYEAIREFFGLPDTRVRSAR